MHQQSCMVPALRGTWPRTVFKISSPSQTLRRSRLLGAMQYAAFRTYSPSGTYRIADWDCRDCRQARLLALDRPNRVPPVSCCADSPGRTPALTGLISMRHSIRRCCDQTHTGPAVRTAPVFCCKKRTGRAGSRKRIFLNHNCTLIRRRRSGSKLPQTDPPDLHLTA